MDKEDEGVEKKTYDKRSPYAIGFTSLVLIGMALFGFFPRYFQNQAIQKQAAFIVPPPQVQVMTVEPNRKTLSITLPSYLQAINFTPIWARVDGYVRNFYVDIGDRIKMGELMADIETPDIDQELAQAQADLARFEAQLNIARITAERWQKTLKNNSEAISLQEVEEKTADYQLAAANVLAGAANVQRLEALQGFNRIYAPFDGVVTQRQVDIGTLVTSGSNGSIEQLFQVAKVDVMRAFIDVPQSYFRLIKDGMSADVLIDQYPDKVFRGTIARNSSALAPIARTLLTQVNVANPDGDLLVGLYAQVKLTMNPDTVTFIIPTTALIIRSGPPYVAVVGNDERVRLQQVEIGLNFGKTVEIISGIKEGDVIVTQPTDRIKEGVQVKGLYNSNLHD